LSLLGFELQPVAVPTALPPLVGELKSKQNDQTVSVNYFLELFIIMDEKKHFAV
jgi:hypothetical protein